MARSRAASPPAAGERVEPCQQLGADPLQQRALQQGAPVGAGDLFEQHHPPGLGMLGGRDGLIVQLGQAPVAPGARRPGGDALAAAHLAHAVEMPRAAQHEPAVLVAAPEHAAGVEQAIEPRGGGERHRPQHDHAALAVGQPHAPQQLRQIVGDIPAPLGSQLQQAAAQQLVLPRNRKRASSSLTVPDRRTRSAR